MTKPEQIEGGTFENPITHASADPTERQRKFCRCAKCHCVEQCTPQRDFWGMKDQPLLCSTCCGPHGQNDLPKRLSC